MVMAWVIRDAPGHKPASTDATPCSRMYVSLCSGSLLLILLVIYQTQRSAYSAASLPLSLHCTVARAASAWGSQKVIAIVRYISMAVESTLRACSCCLVLVDNMPRLRWQSAWRGGIPR